jgi:hypothetical protein
MTVRDIQAHIREMYEVEISPDRGAVRFVV